MDTAKTGVLIADDEMHIRLLMKTVLNSINCEVIGEAQNGEEAVKIFAEKRPGLTLLDINMPVKNGDEALKEIISDYPEALVIMLTSVTDKESVEKCIENGAVNYIRKDTPLEEIKTIIKDALSRRLEAENARKV